MKKPSAECLGISAIIIALGIAFCLSCGFTSLTTHSKQNTKDDSSVEGRILGESRMAFGQYFRRMTNLYSHRGFESRAKTAFQDDIFQKWCQHIAPQEHLHLEGATAKEVLPWLWLAIKMDPHNVENYLVASFLLSSSINKPDIAHQILHEAEQKNPFDYQIPLEDATIFIREQKYKPANLCLTASITLWPSDLDPSSSEAKLGKIYILSYKALLHELNNETKEAIDCFKELSRMQPDDKMLKHRIAMLEQGEETSAQAQETLNHLMKAKDNKQESCTYGEEHVHDEH